MRDPLPILKAALADRYEFERELGGGGMAVVYLATDLRHQRQVAVKVLWPEVAEALGLERFKREVAISARLHHPHILSLYDSGDAHGLLFYVMPFVEGKSLRDRLQQEGQLPLVDALLIASEVAGALEYAHQQRVIHRDIKPENILLSEGQVWVADFGIARAIITEDGETLTKSGLSIGTPGYMSPEQLAGNRDLDERTDVYSLGCVLFEMLAGQQLYECALQSDDDGPSLMAIRSDVPPSLESAVRRALARNPERRIQNMMEFRAAIAPLVDLAPTVPLTASHERADPTGRSETPTVTTLDRMEDIVNVFARFRGLPIRQTFIQSFSPAPSNDVAADWRDEHGNGVTVERVLTLSHAIDLDFAEHSVGLEATHPWVTNHVMLADARFEQLRVTPNITIFGDTAVMVTFPFAEFPFPPTLNDRSDHSIGFLIEDRSVAVLARRHFARLRDAIPRSQSRAEIESAKQLFWNRVQLDYLHAVGDAIFKQLARVPGAVPNTLAIVGSAARLRRERLMREGRAACNDLDILIIFDALTGEILRQTKEVVSGVLARLSSVDFSLIPDFVACPIKAEHSSREFVIQVLVDDLESIQEWTPTIARDWYETAIRRDYPERFLPHGVHLRGQFSSYDLVDQRYGIHDCVNALFGDHSVVGTAWEEGGDAGRPRPVQVKRLVLHEGRWAFAGYAIRWSAANYCRARDVRTPEAVASGTSSEAVEWLLTELRLPAGEAQSVREIAKRGTGRWDASAQRAVRSWFAALEERIARGTSSHGP